MIPRIREVHVRNYKSIAQAVVRLSDLTVLVGPNGSGKTNFVDALAFVQECLTGSIEAALRSRGGLEAVLHRGAAPTDALGVRLVLDLGAGGVADYAFEIAGSEAQGVRVIRERCVVSRRGGEASAFSVAGGRFEEPIAGIRPAVEPNRLALYAASATPEFRGIYEFLSGMALYELDPERLGELQEADPGVALSRTGGNAAWVLDRLRREDPIHFERVSTLLALVVPGIRTITTVRFGPFLTFAFSEDGARPGETMEFQALSMSEGTLRMLGLLLAVYQSSRPSVLLIEDPEAAVHPAAAEVILAVLQDAAKRMQVVLTTHSPDILEDKSVTDENIRSVEKAGGKTIIAPVSAAVRSVIRDRLFSPGELLRNDELRSDPGAADLLARQANLFGEPARAEAA